MAKLVAVCRDDEFPFERRQIPLTIEETLTMVMEIPETVISAECVSSADVSQFIKRYSCLTQSEMNSALTVKQKELFSLLAVSVPCVGCRRSVERLYSQLWESGQPAIEPLIIAASGVLTLSESFLCDAKLIYALFYIHGSHLNDIVDTIPKSRRNRRCILHSLETHKARASGSWMDVWDLLSQECRDEVVLIDSDSLLDTLESYLRKHRFCSECKSKVLKAYSILAGDIVGDAERGYCSGLYEGLKSCPKERHIHVVCDTDFIAHLIGRAEPELAGGRRERHARTIDIAQEEVLTCLGIHLWERLHRLWQKLRAEEQTWQMLFYLGVEALRKSFETAVEDKQGITQLELVVEEISEAERVKEQRKENKRLKKKKRKENKAKLNEEKMQCSEEPNEEKCPVDGNAESNVEYAESIDSEKSSTDSQTSPRKIESNELESDLPSDASLQNSHSSSCGSSMDDKAGGLLKCVNGHDSTSRPCDKDDSVDSLKRNSTDSLLNGSSSATHNKSVKGDISCKNPPTYSCNAKDSTNGASRTKVSADSRHKATESHNSSDTSHQCHGDTKQQEFSKESVDACKCESSNTTNKHHKRNGFINQHHHQDYRGQYKGTHNKRNGYSDCKGCLNVGPRFNRYEDQSRWKGGDHNDYHHSGDVYDKVHSMNGSLHNGRGGRGKRKGYGNKHKEYIDGKNDYYESKQALHNNQSNHQKSQQHVCTSDEVEDADELRLLKMMGWTLEDSHGISEQEIQEFTANRPEVQTRREELRDKLREQFDKLCVNKVFLY